jgi:signal transduction histidine kinase
MRTSGRLRPGAGGLSKRAATAPPARSARRRTASPRISGIGNLRPWWFVTLAGASAVCLLAFGYAHRVRQLRGAETAQRAFSRQLMVSQESERKRIAAELHDGLGQHLVVIKNLALMLREQAGDGMRERIDGISSASSQALNEVREISRNLRPYYLDRFGLTKSLEALVSTAEAASTIEFTADIVNIDDVFPKDVQINVYRAVQESVNNVLKHSNATAATVTVRRSGSQVQIVIEDNGVGFAAEAETVRVGRVGFGLIGITERVMLVGGRAQFDATPDRGTRVSLTFGGQWIGDGI